MTDVSILTTPDGNELAYRQSPATDKNISLPGVIFLHGLRSDMDGTKATFLEEKCRARGQAFLRFDCRGHGQSGGIFTDGCMSDWCADTLNILDVLCEGSQVLVGSSMGGWNMLLAALKRPDKVAGMVGIAAAPDFTEDLWDSLSPEQQADLKQNGIIHLPSDYDEPMPITWKLIEDGRRHRLLHNSISLTCPTRLVQGMADDAVAWQTAPRLGEKLCGEDVEIRLIEDGDHSLSREPDLSLIDHMVQEVSQLAAGNRTSPEKREDPVSRIRLKSRNQH